MFQVFSTVTDFNKQYNLMREDILRRHGHKIGDKVKLVKAIAMYQKFNDNWVLVTSKKTDMTDRIKMYEGKNVEFRLKALV